MLGTILVSFIVMMLVIAGMSIGAILQNKPIKGSCGGVASQDGYDCACAAAGKPRLCEQGADRAKEA